MDWLAGVLTNSCFLAAVTGWFVAQALKIPFTAIVTKRIDWSRFFAAGGMPSSHTAMVVALTIMVAMREGTDSALFAACCAFGSIVMYDAAGVRRETGRQGKAINDSFKLLFTATNASTKQEAIEAIKRWLDVK